MSRQGLRSATSGGDQSQEDLNRTLTEAQENRVSSSSMDLGGHSTDRSHGNEELSESLTKKLDDHEKRVKVVCKKIDLVEFFKTGAGI